MGRLLALGVALGIGVAGCGGGALPGGTAGSAGRGGTGAGAGRGGATVVTGIGGSIQPTDGGSDPFVECSRPQSAVRLRPNHLIVLDTSLIMNAIGCAPGCDTMSRWANAVSGINAAVAATQERVNWGLALFGDATNACGTSSMSNTIDVPVAPLAAQAIAAALAARTNAGGDLIDPSSRPTRNAVNTATRFLSAQLTNGPSYIVLLTAGVPGCAAGAVDPNTDDTARAVDAVFAAATEGFGTLVAALGEQDVAGQTSLLSMAAAGNPGLPGPHAGYYATLTRGDLDDVLRSFVGDTEGCMFEIPPPVNQVPRSDSISVFWEGFEIPHDTTHAEGWDYVGFSMRALQLYGTACEVARSVRTQLPMVAYHCILI